MATSSYITDSVLSIHDLDSYRSLSMLQGTQASNIASNSSLNSSRVLSVCDSCLQASNIASNSSRCLCVLFNGLSYCRIMHQVPFLHKRLTERQALHVCPSLLFRFLWQSIIPCRIEPCSWRCSTDYSDRNGLNELIYGCKETHFYEEDPQWENWIELISAQL